MREIIDFDDVQNAYQRLQGVAHQTPVLTSRTLNSRCGCEVFLKCENFQRGGAFKFRGAYHMISQLSVEKQKQGVIAYSSGNHAQAVALVSRFLGIKAVICMPLDAPPVKVAATREYGAEIAFYDRHKEDRVTFAEQIAKERNLTLVPPYDHPHIMAGQGTAALELLREIPDLDAIAAPIGGGGLISGTCIAAHGINAKINIYGVEPAGADDTLQSLQIGERIQIAPPDTVADGLRSQIPGELTFPVIKNHLAEIVTVSDEEILETVKFAMLRLKIVIEPSAAVALAAVLHNKLAEGCSRIGVLISGGNIAPDLLGNLWK
ncbi:pyridoxal-phosphate dependent enzyme [Paenactinomyces guangxiensis]|uniref:threonine ammonia-lyase n=1 Tax=Paenactinomyces guangxiensis TaxID=1490290 RepID=A0A7W1WNS6_9BACL|nr:pyridoxal-phosphate dependent enzyme [Paenactinomyces guangxiensis]MBA4493139.1 pyridoxal-phosphate dependent enzyme [Paenactinomyces guangxiensis]MBH8590011.1 pyridoxal-phosphate dependent enzyme [Paenactinomyces guangxiensis]